MSERRSFEGFPVAALDFYDDLEMDNTKSFWEAHKDTYAEQVRAPMLALVEALADEFGTAKLFRPYRDVRYSLDKTPYKTHQGAFVSFAPRVGYYVQVGPAGVRVAGGCYHAESADLSRIRAAIDEVATGRRLQRLVADLEAAGYVIEGETLKTSPRGYAADHPRIDLLRRKAVFGSRDYGFEPFIHTAEVLDRIRDDWRATTPLVEWLANYVGE